MTLYLALTLVLLVAVPLCVFQYVAYREHLRDLGEMSDDWWPR
jgi:hypothetical protein